MSKNKGGRPSKQIPEAVKKLEEAFALDCTVKEACFYAGISRETYYTWIKENKKLSDRFEELRQSPVLKARQEVVKGLDDNAEFSLKYLERKRSDEFSLKQKIEHEGEVKIVKNDKELDIMADKVEEELKDKKTNET